MCVGPVKNQAPKIFLVCKFKVNSLFKQLHLASYVALVIVPNNSIKKKNKIARTFDSLRSSKVDKHRSAKRLDKNYSKRDVEEKYTAILSIFSENGNPLKNKAIINT